MEPCPEKNKGIFRGAIESFASAGKRIMDTLFLPPSTKLFLRYIETQTAMYERFMERQEDPTQPKT